MIPDYNDFAREWEAAWNARDLPRILSHYTDDIVFRSRKAFGHIGLGELRGKEQLDTYWQAALKGQPDLKFAVQSVLGGHKMAVIVYANHRNVVAAETLYFRADGLVERASACHEIWDDPDPYRISVDLWVKPGMETAFARYEEQALAALSNYGGRLIEASRPETGPYERHILQFPSRMAFDAYLGGPEYQAARAARESCIERTDIAEVGS